MQLQQPVFEKNENSIFQNSNTYFVLKTQILRIPIVNFNYFQQQQANRRERANAARQARKNAKKDAKRKAPGVAQQSIARQRLSAAAMSVAAVAMAAVSN